MEMAMDEHMHTSMNMVGWPYGMLVCTMDEYNGVKEDLRETPDHTYEFSWAPFNDNGTPKMVGIPLQFLRESVGYYGRAFFPLPSMQQGGTHRADEPSEDMNRSLVRQLRRPQEANFGNDYYNIGDQPQQGMMRHFHDIDVDDQYFHQPQQASGMSRAVRAPVPAMNTSTPVRRRMKQPNDRALADLARARGQLKRVFELCIKQPYNPGWIEDNDINIAFRSATAVNPSRIRWDALCKAGVFITGDILRIAFNPATGGLQTFVDAVVLNDGKYPDIQVAPATAEFDGILKKPSGPIEIFEAMNAHHQHLGRCASGRPWNNMNLIRGNRDYGTCDKVRMAWVLWAEQHNALGYKGFPSLDYTAKR